MNKLQKILPFFASLQSYSTKDFRGDLSAGLTVAVMLIPQGMAYALLAGLPPIYGLYAAIVPLVVYPFFGTSRQLSVGPTALVSLLVLSGISQLAPIGSAAFLNLAILTAVIAGIMQILLGLLRLGFLVNFLSKPVISGFTSAAAFIIAFSQLKNLLGLDLVRSNQIHQIIIGAIQNIQQTHLLTLAIGIGGIILMLGLKKVNKSLPAALTVVVIFIFLTWFFNLEQQGLAVVGGVPKGLPAFVVPQFDLATMQQLLPVSLTICLISFIESLAIAKTIEAKHKSYRVIPNQELIALGITKISGAFFQAFPTTGSFTRSAINNESGANTGISSIISAVLVAFILLFLTPLFYYLPKAILAAIIVVAVKGLIDAKEIKYLWKNDRRDFLTLIATFLVTLTIGIQAGVLTGIILSVGQILYQNSKPHFAILGRIPNTKQYRNINRFPDAIQPTDILVIRFDAQIYFGNTTFFRAKIEDLIDQHAPTLSKIILDASSITDIDSSGVNMLKNLLTYLEARNIQFSIAEAIGPVRDILYKTDLMNKIGKQNHFIHVNDAVAYYEGHLNSEVQKRAYIARQQNIE